MRLLDDMEAEALKMSQMADGFRLAGEKDLARLATLAAYGLSLAGSTVIQFNNALGEQLNHEKEC